MTTICSPASKDQVKDDTNTPAVEVKDSKEANQVPKQKKRGNFGLRNRKEKRANKLRSDSAESNNEKTSDDETNKCDNMPKSRPIFSTNYDSLNYIQKSTKKMQSPHEVVIPYGRLRKERFFYWPPYGNSQSVKC